MRHDLVVLLVLVALAGAPAYAASPTQSDYDRVMNSATNSGPDVTMPDDGSQADSNGMPAATTTTTTTTTNSENPGQQGYAQPLGANNGNGQQQTSSTNTQLGQQTNGFGQVINPYSGNTMNRPGAIAPSSGFGTNSNTGFASSYQNNPYANPQNNIANQQAQPKYPTAPVYTGSSTQ